MASLQTVTQQFFDGRSHTNGRQSAGLLEPGLLYADYGDDDHVFLITVEEIPRRTRRFDPSDDTAVIAAGSARLLHIETSNFVTVDLDVQPDAAGERQVDIGVRDDVGTAYYFQLGEEGGSEHPDRVSRSFRPRPPADATSLTITVVVHGRIDIPAAVTVDLPLASTL